MIMIMIMKINKQFKIFQIMLMKLDKIILMKRNKMKRYNRLNF